MTSRQNNDQHPDPKGSAVDRRRFLASTSALSALPLLANTVGEAAFAQDAPLTQNVAVAQNVAVQTVPPTSTQSIIGAYGSWASGFVQDPGALSFRQDRWKDVNQWRQVAREKATELLAAPDLGGAPEAKVVKEYEYDGLHIEELQWQLPVGRPTGAVLLRPVNAKGPLPAVLGLHDHGGKKYFGKRKITQTSNSMHPDMVGHHQHYYGNRPWANEIAKRGYVVLVHDTFAFASRRVLFEDMGVIPWGDCKTRDRSDENPEDSKNIAAYNQWANAHEHIMAKSLFSAGTTWPGVVLAEDQRALDVLANRPEVDASRIGCAGLSGGGLRTVYLGGMDPRIQCAICVGFMSTWKDFLMHKSFTHTWMTYAPLLPKYLDFPEILGLRAPLPTMVLSNTEDHLYSLSQMKRADEILKEVFTKAGAPQRYRGGFYPGDHKFDVPMQKDAFDWFDRWLKAS